MHLRDGRRICSPTDLANFLACRHLSVLDLATLAGTLRPPVWADPVAETLRRRGEVHERGYVDHLRASGRSITDLSAVRTDRVAALVATRAAMADGADVIVQGALGDDAWFGFADVLVRVDLPSALGSWSYEVHDTKLARETRGGSILQLCVYSELLAAVQACMPDVFRVVTPAGIEVFRTSDYAAYYRIVKALFREWLETPAPLDDRLALVPSPTEHCAICRWWPHCNAARRRVDHLSFVANLGRIQEAELDRRGIHTLAALAAVPVPLPFKPSRGARVTYEALCDQARLQNARRETGKPTFELLPFEPDLGLGALPAPTSADLFLDLESARYACDGGREYLFGLGWREASGGWQYEARWALTAEDEVAAFEKMIDRIRSARALNPGLHIYHFGAYEPAAFKRLMGRYATRTVELDELLRGECFIDLLAVVRHALRAGVESYSIKELEVLYGFTRAVALTHASDARRLVEQALETGDRPAITDDVRTAVQGYNEDDCRSVLELRAWLEQLRAGAIAQGALIERPSSGDSTASEQVTERQARVKTLRAALLARASRDRPEDAEALRILAYLLDWHDREDKADWWEYFRLRDMSDEDLLDERQAVSGLTLCERMGPVISSKTGQPTKSVIDRYRFPPQDCEIRPGADLRLRAGGSFGKVMAIDRSALTVDVRKGPSRAETHPTAAFAFEHVRSDILSDALARVGEAVCVDGFSDRPGYGAACDLLLRRSPRVGGRPLGNVPPLVGESTEKLVTRLVADLDDTVLPIQGPPGSGKTRAGARMIRQLVALGRRVGVTATSHKVIRKLLTEVADASANDPTPIALGHKVGERESAGRVIEFVENSDALGALQSHQVDVLGGTAYLWARPEFTGAVDVLVVDEAGQMSLANVLAVSQAARSLVLLGDPRQLEQPQKAIHPEGVGVSALDHILGEQATMPADRGLFLPTTYRLAPAICQATSEIFYEGKLSSFPGAAQVRLSGTGRFEGVGLWCLDVVHQGNRSASDEEAEVVASVIDELCGPAASWIDAEGRPHPLTDADILVVAPYNAHVNRVDERLRRAGRAIRVGTVDRFQGQEAPVVIYTMASSSADDAPKGIDFLYSANRLNVATSRARAAVILVASPRLFEPECRSPRQMRLANALCRMRELATVIATGQLR